MLKRGLTRRFYVALIIVVFMALGFIFLYIKIFGPLSDRTIAFNSANIEIEEISNLSHAINNNFFFSPNGEYLAYFDENYLLNVDNLINGEKYEVYKIKDLVNSISFDKDVRTAPISWSPDSKKILFYDHPNYLYYDLEKTDLEIVGKVFKSGSYYNYSEGYIKDWISENEIMHGVSHSDCDGIDYCKYWHYSIYNIDTKNSFNVSFGREYFKDIRSSHPQKKFSEGYVRRILVPGFFWSGEDSAFVRINKEISSYYDLEEEKSLGSKSVKVVNRFPERKGEVVNFKEFIYKNGTVVKRPVKAWYSESPNKKRSFYIKSKIVEGKTELKIRDSLVITDLSSGEINEIPILEYASVSSSDEIYWASDDEIFLELGYGLLYSFSVEDTKFEKTEYYGKRETNNPALSPDKDKAIIKYSSGPVFHGDDSAFSKENLLLVENNGKREILFTQVIDTSGLSSEFPSILESSWSSDSRYFYFVVGRTKFNHGEEYPKDWYLHLDNYYDRDYKLWRIEFK